MCTNSRAKRAVLLVPQLSFSNFFTFKRQFGVPLRWRPPHSRPFVTPLTVQCSFYKLIVLSFYEKTMITKSNCQLTFATMIGTWKAITRIPLKTHKLANILPGTVRGYISPYPTVVMVATAHQQLAGMLEKLLGSSSAMLPSSFISQ